MKFTDCEDSISTSISKSQHPDETHRRLWLVTIKEWRLNNSEALVGAHNSMDECLLCFVGD